MVSNVSLNLQNPFKKAQEAGFSKPQGQQQKQQEATINQQQGPHPLTFSGTKPPSMGFNGASQEKNAQGPGGSHPFAFEGAQMPQMQDKGTKLELLA